MEVLSYFLQHGKFQKLESEEYSDLVLLLLLSSSLLLVIKILIMETKLDFTKRNQKTKQHT